MSEFKELKKFIELAKNSGVSELEFEDDKYKFFVSFVGEKMLAAPQFIQHAPAALAKSSETSNDSGYHLIKAPFVGTFYSSPGPGEPAFVKKGDKISKSQTLCILEAMKIMNEIESEIQGTIEEICVENESFVEFDQVLFKIKPNN